MPEYRPERWWRVLNAFGGAALVAFGAFLGVFALESADPWAYALTGLTVGLGALWLVRLPRARITCTPDSLVVVGLFWTRRIPRRDITSVESDPHTAAIVWRTSQGRWRFTPLTLLWGGTYGWMPQASMGKRSGFLKQVRRWSRGKSQGG